LKRKASKSPPRETQGDELTLIRKLADMLNATGLTDIELEKGAMRIRVSKNASAAATTVFANAPAAPQAVATAATVSVVKAGRPKDHPSNLKSPMVGTAYLTPSPGAPPFAAVGTTVKQGQTVLIIEAMKTMNQIPAHASGTITEILIDNGKPVEFDQVLMVIE
jgi:acetyl-CoA carboxylase biotin carboxyl carrier protein